ncbi:MAG TPA: hypothetical protein VJ489_00455, partial [Thermoplasmata archaeon]|nr:hypothetical protein [Thermoplasmata archaeon]
MLHLPEISDDFKRVEGKKGQYLKTSLAGGERLGPHSIMLSKGTVPDYIKLSSFQDLAWRTMGRSAKARSSNNQQLDESLLKAHMKIRPEEYLAYVLMATLVAAIVGVAIGIGVGIVLFSLLGVSMVLRILVAVLAIALPPLMAYFLLMGSPGSKAKTRGRDIDKRIAAAMSFISAMASADVNIDVIFKEL